MEITRDELLESGNAEVDHVMPDSTTPDSMPNASPCKKQKGSSMGSRSAAISNSYVYVL